MRSLKRFARYLFVGGLNTLFGFLAYSVLILLNAPTWVALVVGNIAGIVFNFFTVGGLVFRNLRYDRIVRFAACYLFILAVNLNLIEWIMRYHSDRIVAQAILVLPIAVLSYFLMARFVFVNRAIE